MKLFLMTFTVLAAAGVLFAQTGPGVSSRVSVGGGTTIASYRSGGFAEIGVPLRVGRGWSIRDYLELGGYGTSTMTGGILSLGDKVTVGGRWPNGIETYAFVTGSFGLFAAGAKAMQDAPFLWGVEGGGGMQIVLGRRLAYFAELGGGWNAPTSEPGSYTNTPIETGYAVISMGFRNFF